jgi:hypothetical protein
LDMRSWMMKLLRPDVRSVTWKWMNVIRVIHDT